MLLHVLDCIIQLDGMVTGLVIFLIISLTCSHVSKVPCIHVFCFMVITYGGHSGSWKNQSFLEGGIVPFYGVNSHGEFIIVLIPPQVMMHLLYILAFYSCHMQPQLVDLYATHLAIPVCV